MKQDTRLLDCNLETVAIQDNHIDTRVKFIAINACLDSDVALHTIDIDDTGL